MDARIRWIIRASRGFRVPAVGSGSGLGSVGGTLGASVGAGGSSVVPLVSGIVGRGRWSRGRRDGYV